MKQSTILRTLFFALTGALIFGLAFPELAFAAPAGAVLFQALHFTATPLESLAFNAISDQVKTLAEKQSDLLRQMNAIYAEGQKREGFAGLNENEKSRYAELKKQFDAIAGPLSEARELEKLNLENAATKGAVIPGAPANQGISSGDQRDMKKFSFQRAVQIERGAVKFDGIEREMHDEGQAEIQKSALGVTGKGVYIPYKVLSMASAHQRDVNVTTPGDGGNAVATELGSFIDALNNKLVLREAGADFLTGLVGNVEFPAEATVASATWEGETDANVETSPTFAKVGISPKRLGTYILASNQLLMQTSPSIEARLKNQLLNAISLGIDNAGVNGSGSGAIPEGILDTSGIGSVVGGTDGAAPTWAHIVALEKEIDVDNALMGNLAYLTNSKVKAALKTTPKESGQALYILGEVSKELNGHPSLFTNMVPSNLTKGSATAICSAIIFGNFADLLIGQWGGMEILTNPYTAAKTAQTELIVNVFADVLVRRPQSFAAMLDALA